MTDLIKLELFDHDSTSKDDLIATHYFSFEEIKKAAFSNRWLNFYGPSHPDSIVKLDNGKNVANEMAMKNIEPDMWCGRVLMDVSSTVLSSSGRVARNELSFSASDPETETYTLRCDLFSATDIFGDKIFVKFIVGPNETVTEDKKVEGKECHIFESVEMKMDLPKNSEDIPNLFVNIYKRKGLSKNRAGWLKLNLKTFLEKKEPEDLWIPIETNYFGDNPKEQAGFLHFNLNFKPESVMRNIPKKPLTKPELTKYNLRAKIYQARNLSAADQNGSSDPFCVIRCGGAKAKTKTIMDNLYPNWNEEISMVVNLPKDLRYAPMINISVMDYDKYGIDDRMGKTMIPISKFTEKSSEPTWYPIFDRNPNQKEGEILASFQLIPFEKSRSIPISSIEPKLIKSQVDFGLISGKNFNFTSYGKKKESHIELFMNERKQFQKSVIGHGYNPIFLQQMSMQANIPQDPTFESFIHLSVMDDKRKFKPILGTGNLSLFSYIPWNKKAEESKKELLLESLPPPVKQIHSLFFLFF